jgi:hypothetical protein
MAPTRRRSIKFADQLPIDPRAPSMLNRSLTTRPVPPSTVRRSSTIHYTRPHSIGGGTVNIEPRPLLGRAPSAQFDIITPPHSPTNTSGPSRPKLANSSSDFKHFPTVNRGVPQEHPSVRGVCGPSGSHNIGSKHCSYNVRSSLIPTRKNIPVLGWAESQASQGTQCVAEPMHFRNSAAKAWDVSTKHDV